MKRLPRHTLVLASLVFLLASSTGRSQDNNDLAKRALTLLEERCFSCHGEEGVAEGGLNFILNPPRLVAREIVVPGDALNSKLYRMVKSGDMPRDDDPLTPQKIELLRKWIDSDGPGFKPLPLNRKFISPENTLELIQKDLKEIDSNDQRFHRYFTITHLYNAGIPDSELETYRRALSKLINSLSWGGTIVRPVPIDPARTVLRIDINDFLWTEETWDRILEENPYGVTYDKPVAAYCYKATGTDQPFIRADWFVARASVPPLYHDILEMPATDRELEERLRVNVDRNLQIGRAARAGFNGSGVSQNNRLIERHVADLTRGAYWKSYDFSANSGVQNLFARPLGPNGRNAFEHAGGEIIFNLPNGLQAYLLVDAKGNRIDKGPTEIVGDPKRPDGAVVNGLSCMSCHTRGMIFKDDQIRRAVQGNDAFSADVRNEVKRLYVPKRDFRRLQEADAKRFANAVTETGGAVGTTEPILTLALRFEEELDLPLAAAEAGLPTTEFLAGVKNSQQLARTLAPLLVDGGTVKRDVYIANFGSIVANLKPGGYFRRYWKSAILTHTLHGHSEAVESVSFSPDGKRIVSGGGEEIKIWDTATGQEIRTLQIDTESVSRDGVLSVSFSPDGKQIVSGQGRYSGSNRPSPGQIKVWNAATGQEVLTLQGHPRAVRSVAYSPDGKRIVSGGESGWQIASGVKVDRADLKVWDATTGEETLTLKGHSVGVYSVNFSPDGRRIVSGSGGKTVKIWDAQSGQEMLTLKGHTEIVISVAFSPDGKRIASGGYDKTVKIWDAATGQETLTLEGHSGLVSSVSFSPDGKWIVSGGPGHIKIWDAVAGEEVLTIPVNDFMSSLSLSPDGTRIAIGCDDMTVKIWNTGP